MKTSDFLVKTIILLTVLMGVTMNALADETPDYTYILSAGDFSSDISTHTENGIAWTATWNTKKGCAYEPNYNKGFKFGISNDAYPETVSIVSSTFSRKIKKIVVYSSVNSSKSVKLDVKVGKSSYGNQVTIKTNETTAYTFESTSETQAIAGAITLSYTKSNSPIYLYKVEVYYWELIGDSPNLTVISSSVNMDTTTELDASTLYSVSSDGQITYFSTDEAVVKVENGILKALKPGEADIKINVAQTASYYADSVVVHVVVTSKDPVAPAGSEAGLGYCLVTDATTLTAGDKLLLVSSREDGKAMAMCAYQKKTNNRDGASVFIADKKIETISDSVQIITLEGKTNAWYFNVGNGYLCAASSGDNYLKTETKKDDNAKAIITIDSESRASIKFQGNFKHNDLRYNPVNELFSCYDNTQDKVFLYRYTMVPSYNIEIGESGWRSIVSAHNVLLPEGLTAYIVTGCTDNNLTLTKVTSIVKNTPVLLQGEAGTYTLTIIDDAAYNDSNLLKISTETTGNGVYVLAKKNEHVGFYKWSGGSLGAGRVYIEASTSTARECLTFEFENEDITGIKDVAHSTISSNNSAYDLQGRRVINPTKGLYIKNGRKYTKYKQ